MEQDTTDSGSWKASPSGMPLDSDRSDLLMVHFLRLLCSSLSGWADNFSHIVKDIHRTDLFTQGALDLARESPEVFYGKFDTRFSEEKVERPNSFLWKHFASRFENDFRQPEYIGHGGCGSVEKATNKLDGELYAVKKIGYAVKDIGLSVSSEREFILREVTAMSKMNHSNVVRYYSAWFEMGPYDPDVSSDDSNEVKPQLGELYDFSDDSNEEKFLLDQTCDLSDDSIEEKVNLGQSYLFIQMEYCKGRSLAEFLSNSDESLEEGFAWSIARQITEGLQHIHANEVIHGDLKPDNIFFDNDVKNIKIGDFGLAELKKSGENKIKIGEIWCKIPGDSGGSFEGKQGDIQSFGVIFFQLWRPFWTDDSEREEVLSSLKENEGIPATWTADFPTQSEILSRLISRNPPSAEEVLELFPQQLPG